MGTLDCLLLGMSNLSYLIALIVSYLCCLSDGALFYGGQSDLPAWVTQIRHLEDLDTDSYLSDLLETDDTISDSNLEILRRLSGGLFDMSYLNNQANQQNMMINDLP